MPERIVPERTMPLSFLVMAKPAGARCNLDCAYCFFLKKETLYPGSRFRMSDEVMEQYVRQTIAAQQGPQVTIAWQGGEPTLMGLDFYRRAMVVEKKYAKPGQTIENTFQTNGILLDDAWCEFLCENQFLVGISLDGPRSLHDAYRRDKGGQPTFDRVVRAVRRMQEHQVEFNVLCTVNAVNCRQPLDVYRFFRDELGARYLQFIPIVEKEEEGREAGDEGVKITDRSVSPEQYGRFLIEIFDEWVRRDVGSTFVPFFDAVLASYVYGRSSLCVLRPACGDALALEHNGDLYSCDHFVEPNHRLGNILETPLAELAWSEKQRAFGQAKSAALPRACRECKWLFTCHGECPKNRVLKTPDGESGLNWLCAGLKAFFAHTERPMREMADLLKSGRYADEIMIRKPEEARHAAMSTQSNPRKTGIQITEEEEP
jgi:uncharacterized protein